MPKTKDSTATHKLNGLKQSTHRFLGSLGDAFGNATGAGGGDNPASALVGRAGEMLGRVFDEMTTVAGNLSGEAQRDFDQVMRILDPNQLVDSFRALITGISEAIARLAIKLLQEIKKIIRVLWDLLFGGLPKWLETVLLLIDELARHAVELLFPQLAGELSSGEVGYLKEIHASRRISLLEKSRRPQDEE